MTLLSPTVQWWYIWYLCCSLFLVCRPSSLSLESLQMWPVVQWDIVCCQQLDSVGGREGGGNFVKFMSSFCTSWHRHSRVSSGRLSQPRSTSLSAISFIESQFPNLQKKRSKMTFYNKWVWGTPYKNQKIALNGLKWISISFYYWKMSGQHPN